MLLKVAVKHPAITAQNSGMISDPSFHRTYALRAQDGELKRWCRRAESIPTLTHALRQAGDLACLLGGIAGEKIK